MPFLKGRVNIYQKNTIKRKNQFTAVKNQFTANL